MTDARILRRGDTVPHFEVRSLLGAAVSYGAIWQHKSLVLVCLPADALDDPYVLELSERLPDFHEHSAVCVITQDAVTGVPAPGVLVADKWGEIVHVAARRYTNELPRAPELLDWTEHLGRRCPECEGEAK